MPFKCPVCRCHFYEPVTVTRPDGRPYRTEFLRCAGCTAMFTEPELFSQDAIEAMDCPAEMPTMAHEQATLRQRLTWRYWHARLKREGAGMEPKSEEVSRAVARGSPHS